MSTFEIRGIVKVSFEMTITGGPISVPGMKVGDRLFSLLASESRFEVNGGIEPVITVDDEIQQPLGYGAPNLTTPFVALFYRD